MAEKRLTSARLVGILNGLNDETGAALLAKRLPAKLLYALHRSIPGVTGAYNAYKETLAALCKSYGVTPDTWGEVAPERKDELEKELGELLGQETTVPIHTISPEVLECCGEGGYDALTYAEMERLAWLLEED